MKLKTAIIALSLAPAAYGVPEPDTLYGARSVGMGGTAVAVGDLASAGFYNTAAFAEVKALSLQFTVTPYLPKPSGSFVPGARTEGSRTLAPLPMASVAYRVHERVVVGFATFGAGGGGAKFASVPAFGGLPFEAQAFILEFQVPVAIRLTPELSLGLAYRAGMGQAKSKIPTPVDPTDPAAGLVVPEASLSGFAPAAVQAGLHYRPTSALSLGLGYRSKMSVDVSGDAKLNGQVVASDVELNLSEPHRFVLGGAMKLMEDRLLVAADLSYWLYSNSHPATPTRAAKWKNSYRGAVGAEFRVGEALALRTGYALTRMATPDAAAVPYEWPPGLRHALTVGAGWRADRLALDAGLAYAFVPTRTIAAGSFQANSIIGSLSVGYTY